MSETEEIMSACSLCPRDCHVDRNAGKKGFCGEDKTVYLAESGTSYVGRTLYFRKERIRGSVFFRLRTEVLLLSEP